MSERKDQDHQRDFLVTAPGAFSYGALTKETKREYQYNILIFFVERLLIDQNHKCSLEKYSSSSAHRFLVKKSQCRFLHSGEYGLKFVMFILQGCPATMCPTPTAPLDSWQILHFLEENNEFHTTVMSLDCEAPSCREIHNPLNRVNANPNIQYLPVSLEKLFSFSSIENIQCSIKNLSGGLIAIST